MMLVAANVLYTAPLTLAWISAWYLLRGLPVDVSAVQVVTLTNVICVVFVTHAYETVFLIRERESDMMRVERLERMRVEGELAALHSQIDPHFLFNSLNTLGHVIAHDPVRARDFCDRLAEVYRYVLASRGRQLVSLQEELDFVANYYALLALRFGAAIELVVEPARHDAPTPRRGSRRWHCRPCSRTRSSTTGFDPDAPLGMRLTRHDGGGPLRPRAAAAQQHPAGHRRRPGQPRRALPPAHRPRPRHRARRRRVRGDGAAGGRGAPVNLFLVEDEAPARERLIETHRPGRAGGAHRRLGRFGAGGARLAGRESAARPDAARRAARRRPVVRAVRAAGQRRLPGDLRHRLRRVRARGLPAPMRSTMCSSR